MLDTKYEPIRIEKMTELKTDQLANLSGKLDNKFKLCIVTPSFVGGGAERIAVNLANYYAEQGVDVSLLVFKGIGPYANQVSDKVRLIDLKITRTRYVFFKLLKALKNERPTHVLSVIRGSNILLGLASFFGKNYRLLFREANTMNAIVSLPLIKRITYKAVMRFSYINADGVIANSEDTKDDLIKNSIVGNKKISVVGNPVLPVDYKEKSEATLNHAWFDSHEFKVALSVGRLHSQKNQQLLVRAFARVSRSLPDLRLVILGEGEQKANLEKLAAELGVVDKFEIIAFQANPYPYYRNADLFILTSDWEGFGNVLVEAMACGTPVISTDCPGGPKTILQNGQLGTLIPVGDEEALASALLMHFQGQKKTDIEAAIDNARKYTVQSVAKQYLMVLLGNGQAAS